MEDDEHDRREDDQAGDAMRQQMVDPVAESHRPRGGMPQHAGQQRADGGIADFRFARGDPEAGLCQPLARLRQPLAQVLCALRGERLFDVPIDVQK